MDITSSIVLAVVQGLTEFLPVSSSGHLVIVRELLHIQDGLITFDILVHLGTLISVFLVFWGDVKALVCAVVGIVGDVLHGCPMRAAVSKDDYRNLACLIVLASLPAAIMGVVFKPVVHMLFSSKLAVGIFLVATGAALWLGELFSKNSTGLFDLKLWQVLCIGIAQGLAIAPGFSRSGATISAGLVVGLHKQDAARFSFLLSIPVILGAGILELKNLGTLQLAMGSSAPLVAGFIASIISGYLAIRLLLAAVKRRRLTVFTVYTWILGIAVILWSVI